MVTEDQLTVKAVLLQKWVTFEHTDMHRTNSGNIFFVCFLFISNLLLL